MTDIAQDAVDELDAEGVDVNGDSWKKETIKVTPRRRVEPQSRLTGPPPRGAPFSSTLALIARGGPRCLY